MKIYHDLQQRSPEWHAVRAQNFTASELGEWVLEPVKVKLTVDEIKAELDRIGICRKGLVKRDELIGLLVKCSSNDYSELCEGARTAILSKIKQGRFADMMARDEDELTEEEAIWLARERELAEQRERQFSFNVPVKYGNLLEPYARDWYQKHTGFDVTEVGFIEHDSDSGGFGCSPDGLCLLDKSRADSKITHGLEIKCPVPETHLAWWIEYDRTGMMPECHRLQVHASLAVTGLSEWHFLSYCPGDLRPLRVPVMRDAFTDQLEAGLKTLVAEKAKMMQRLAQIWRDGKGEG